MVDIQKTLLGCQDKNTKIEYVEKYDVFNYQYIPRFRNVVENLLYLLSIYD